MKPSSYNPVEYIEGGLVRDHAQKYDKVEFSTLQNNPGLVKYDGIERAGGEIFCFVER
jgi:hypothetical protein